MDEYLRKFKHMRRHSHGGTSGKGFKKFIIGAVVAVVLVIVVFIILAILLLNWLFDRGGEQVDQAGKAVTEQVQSLPAQSLDLQNYITDGQVDTAQLEQVYNALPASLQDMWLNQLHQQIEELKNQAGISDETIRTLTTLYETLQQAQGE